MFKKIFFIIIIILLLLIISLKSCNNGGKEFFLDSNGGIFDYQDLRLEIGKNFTQDEIKLRCSSFKSKKGVMPFSVKNNLVYEFSFKTAGEIKDGLKILMPNTNNMEIPIGFVGIYEGSNESGGFKYYPVMGQIVNDKYLFEIPKQALKKSILPMKAMKKRTANAAYAADSIRGYAFRWFMPSDIKVKITENFRIFSAFYIKNKIVEAAAEELESKYKVYSIMGYKFFKQKTLGKLNVYIGTASNSKTEGKIIGKKIWGYNLYSFIFINGTKSIKTVRDTCTHELFHVAQLNYTNLPLWLEEATATYMEKYSSAYKGYPATSKIYHNILLYEGFSKTFKEKIPEDHFGYALSTYIKFIMQKLKPEKIGVVEKEVSGVKIKIDKLDIKRDGLFLRKVFKHLHETGIDPNLYMFDKLIGKRKEWMTYYYIDFLSESIYPYKEIGNTLVEYKKNKKNYSLNPESLLGKSISLKLGAYKPNIMLFNFLDAEEIKNNQLGLYYEDNYVGVDLILAVVKYTSKEEAPKTVFVKKLYTHSKTYIPKKYFVNPYYKIYLAVINKNKFDINNYQFSLKTDLLGSNVFENIDYMDAHVTYTVDASEKAQKLYAEAIAKKSLTRTRQQRSKDYWGTMFYEPVVTALKYNGKSYSGKCRVKFDKEKSFIMFSFSDPHYSTHSMFTDELKKTGYLNWAHISVKGSVHKENIVITEEKTKDFKLYGKAITSIDDNNNVEVNMNLTREIYVRGNKGDYSQEGSIHMDIKLVSF